MILKDVFAWLRHVVPNSFIVSKLIDQTMERKSDGIVEKKDGLFTHHRAERM